ncbi:MAG: ABC transporter ATP-binding protein [Candidatus Omnitrophica bacterium]|nr:ABC transporter ATP-binding protein [Candidatus Omnitrophota bacterium]
MSALLEIRHLSIGYRTDGGLLRAVDDVSLTVPAGQTVGLVGESGSGKSTLALAVTRLLPSPPAEMLGGAILFEGRDLLNATTQELQAIRGGQIGYVFQEPATSLNPVYTVGTQLLEAIHLHTPHRGAAATEYAVDLLTRVGMPDPAQRLRAYPHELSGGMKQRVMLAMAIAAQPKLLIADEPTTALDVTIQVQILQLLQRLQDELSLSLLFISHDWHLVESLADSVGVMQTGRLVEFGPRDVVLRQPTHPYTRHLLQSVPAVPWLEGP